MIRPRQRSHRGRVRPLRGRSRVACETGGAPSLAYARFGLPPATQLLPLRGKRHSFFSQAPSGQTALVLLSSPFGANGTSSSLKPLRGKRHPFFRGKRYFLF